MVKQQQRRKIEQKNLFLETAKPEDFRLMSDEVFSTLAREPAFMEETLRVLLGDPLLKVQQVIPEVKQTGIRKRVAIDAFVRLGNGTIVDVEVQCQDEHDTVLRAEYYGQVLRVNQTKRNTEYSDLPTVYVIFICDFLIEGRDQHAVEPILPYFVNPPHTISPHGVELYMCSTRVDDGTKAAELLKCYTQRGVVRSENFPVLSQATEELYRKENGRMISQRMSELLEECYGDTFDQLRRETKEAEVKGKAEGKEEGIIEAIKNLYKNGASIALLKKSYPNMDIASICKNI